MARLEKWCVGLLLVGLGIACGQRPTWSDLEKPIAKRLDLRKLPDDERAQVTRQLALEIRQLPAAVNKVSLASNLANLATEGDFGRDTLQEVTTTLEGALREQPLPPHDREPARPYLQLAQLVRYEGMKAELDSPHFAAAMRQLESEEKGRKGADFNLKDLNGKEWSIKGLRGQVVLVNFWATWCPPCRKEMPDLDALYERFGPDGFAVLAISDEAAEKLKPFIAEKKYRFPVLLDQGGEVNKLLRVGGIPKTFVYDREGNLVAESIDMRTKNQFLKMLEKAGLR